MPNKITIIQGKTFSDTIRWHTDPLVFKPISGISLASGAPRLLVNGHGIADKWPVAVTRVVGMSQINAKGVPPTDRDYVDATKIDVSTLELNRVSPVENGREWPPYESGGFIQYYTPVDLAGLEFVFMLRRSFSDRLLLKCAGAGSSGASAPTAAGLDGTVTWEATTDPTTTDWVAGKAFILGDVVDAKALVRLSSDGMGIVADNAKKTIISTIEPSVTAALRKGNYVYEIEAKVTLDGTIRRVDSGEATVELEGAT